TTVAVKKVNDVTRLQALVDKKNVVVTKATIRDALRLDDVEGRKFNVSKHIFDSLVRNVDSPTKFYMYPRFLQLMIRKQVGDLSTHTTKYTSPALTQKVAKGDADEVHGEDVNVADVVTEWVISVKPTPPQSPQVQPQSPQPQPQQDAEISMNLLQELMDTCIALTKRVEHLELDKIAQALEITKLKQRVKKLERRNKPKVLKLRRLKWVGLAQRIDTSDDTVMDDDVAADAKDGQDADVQDNADIQRRTAKSQAEIYKIDLDNV
nr:hypothetical protein [Tanacetum cinerariifolium]